MPFLKRKPNQTAAEEVVQKFGLTRLTQVLQDSPEYYIQDTGSCGLATLLMIFRPVSNHLDTIFDQIWDRIAYLYPKQCIKDENNSGSKPNLVEKSQDQPEKKTEKATIKDSVEKVEFITPEMTTRIAEPAYPREKISEMEDVSIQRSYRWQKTLEWLLFQITTDSGLQNYLNTIFGEDFPNLYLPKLAYRIKQWDPKVDWMFLTADQQYALELKPEDIERLTGDWLTHRYQQWKEDFEIIMLAALFGYIFIPWLNSDDGTGALYFREKEQKGKNRGSQKRKVKKLEDHLKQGGILLLIEEDHWKVVRSLNKKQDRHFPLWAMLQDPLSGKDVERAVQSLFEQERFYFFMFSQDLQTQCLTLIDSLLKNQKPRDIVVDAISAKVK